MTRDEFLEQVDCWDALLEFDRENGFGYFDGIISNEEMYDRVEQQVSEAVGELPWTDIRDYLNGISDAYSFYRDCSDDEWFGFYGVDDEFDSSLEEFVDYMDDNGYWDDPDEAEEVHEDEPVEDPAFETSDITLEGLVEICRADVPHLSVPEEPREDGWHEFEPGKFTWVEAEANP